jgi:hypothetical protein
MDTTTRRQFLCACASGAVAALAGCSGDGDDGTDGADGTDGPDGSEPTEDGSTGTPVDGTSGDGSSALLGETASFPDSYALTATTSASGETIELSGRVHQGNMYWEFQRQGQQMEWYVVDGESYFVTGGQCFRGGMMQQGLDREAVDPDRFAEQADAYPDVEPAGRDTIDGEEVLVYEVSAGGTTGSERTVTYYVLADSGYPRRIEADSIRMDFSSWGEADPVEPPDANCQQMPGGGMTGTPGI